MRSVVDFEGRLGSGVEVAVIGAEGVVFANEHGFACVGQRNDRVLFFIIFLERRKEALDFVGGEGFEIGDYVG